MTVIQDKLLPHLKVWDQSPPSCRRLMIIVIIILIENSNGTNTQRKQPIKGRKWLSLLKRLVSTKLGSLRNTLKATYKAFVKPILQHFSEALITTPKSVTHKLKAVQNQALWIITVGTKSAPIPAKEALTNNTPILSDIQWNSQILYEKLKRLPNNNYWRNYK